MHLQTAAVPFLGNHSSLFPLETQPNPDFTAAAARGEAVCKPGRTPEGLATSWGLLGTSHTSDSLPAAKTKQTHVNRGLRPSFLADSGPV